MEILEIGRFTRLWRVNEIEEQNLVNPVKKGFPSFSYVIVFVETCTKRLFFIA